MEASLNGALGRTALGQGTLKIGRAPNNTLVINDPQSSAHHAEVAPGFDGSSYQVTDLNSTNGTFVNEQRLTANLPRPLTTGDVIRIGALRFTYEASSGYMPTVAASSAFNSDQTVAAQPPVAQPTIYQQPPVGNYNPPAQPSITPPAAFQPPVMPGANYPQPGAPGQPGYQQPGSFNQQGYPQPGYPQPGYPQPGGFPQPTYPQPKKKRVGLWIGLIILLLVLIGGSVGIYAYVNRSTPEKTLQAYCTALQNNDAQGVYNTFSSESQANTDLNKISTGLQALKLLFGGFTNCTYSNVQQNGSTATATVTLTPVRGKVFGAPAHLVDENGQWKINNTTTNPTT
jgi:FHA domain-containing protein